MHRSAMPHFRHGIDQLEALIHSGQCFESIGTELREHRKPTKRVRALLATIGSPAEEPLRSPDGYGPQPREEETAPGPAPVLVVVEPDRSASPFGPSIFELEQAAKPSVKIVTPQLPALAGMTPLGIKKSNAPTCKQCQRSGNGVTFAMMSPHGFGKYCTDCEAGGIE